MTSREQLSMADMDKNEMREKKLSIILNLIFLKKENYHV